MIIIWRNKKREENEWIENENEIDEKIIIIIRIFDMSRSSSLLKTKGQNLNQTEYDK
jgi:hypothetical protein